MIIKGDSDKRTFSAWFVPAFLLLALAITLVTSGVIGTSDKTGSDVGVIYCDAEIVEVEYFISNGSQFENGQTQNSHKAHTGQNASLTNADNPIGMKFNIPYPEAGDAYRIRVWRYAQDGSPGYIAVRSSDGVLLNESSNQHIQYDKNWWFQLEMTFAIPEDTTLQAVEVFVENRGDQNIYFDDFEIEKLQASKSKASSTFFNKIIQLLIEPQAQEQLNRLRENAQLAGVFIRDENSWVKAAIRKREINQKISVRYKGDWLDHILGGQPSYRIECKSDETWYGLQSFSIQHPKTRGYLREWVYHDLLRQVDVLSPRYDFIHVKVNNDPSKVYAIEEHFTKYLVENQKRREGPIIKLSEDHYWEGMARHFKANKGLAPPSNKERALWTSNIEAFKAKRTYKDTTLRKQFQIAQNLVYQYKYELAPVDEIFDLDKLAKFMAVSELCLANHSLTWHNQRFYYNPVIGLLEPVGFDCSVLGDEVGAFTKNLYAQQVYLNPPYSTEPINRIFYDKKFLELFFFYLDEYSQSEFIQSYLATRKREIDKRVSVLQKSKKDYKYNKVELVDRARKIQIELQPFAGALRVFSHKSKDDSVMLEFHNNHNLPLEVSLTNDKNASGFLVVPQRRDVVPTYIQMTVPNYVRYVYSRLPGDVAWHKTEFSPWSSPKNESPRGKMLGTSSLNDTALLFVSNQDVTIKSGTHRIDHPIIIPKGFKLRILPGTELHFVNEGKLISQSPVLALGTEDLPIIISSDGSAGSVAILQSADESYLNHVIFDQQNTMSYEGWTLTGAVTFFESDVIIDRCKFINNVCEDALNIIRSNFTISNVEFVNIHSDAFDADFCTGSLSFASFLNTGNDAIDFSTSIVDIDNCTMNKIGDKAISAGEQATIKAHKIAVEDANIAFASKDRSMLDLSDVSIKNCRKGFTAYQKKPEFGPATIKVKQFTEEGTSNLFLIEENSVLVQ